MEQEEIKKEVNSEEIEKLIKNNVLISIGIGLAPIPIFDFVAVTGVQLNMIRKMAIMYNIPFSHDKGKNIIASLIGGTITASFGSILGSLLKIIPIIGQTTGALSFSATAGATTYAVGKVMAQHFASGGTFLDFDPEKVKEYYKSLLSKGEKVVNQLKKDGKVTEEIVSET